MAASQQSLCSSRSLEFADFSLLQLSIAIGLVSRVATSLDSRPIKIRILIGLESRLSSNTQQVLLDSSAMIFQVKQN